VPAGSRYPSQVIQLAGPGYASAVPLALDATGTQLWMLQVGLGSNSTVYAIGYPSGAPMLSFTVTDPAWPTGFAVSPAYFS
jgi:hypothetical protein